MENESAGGETGGATHLGDGSRGNPRGEVATDFEEAMGTENQPRHRWLGRRRQRSGRGRSAGFADTLPLAHHAPRSAL